jgi:hypothetical protein
MHAHNDTPLRIHPLGLDERSKTALSMVFRGPGRGSFVLADESIADVAIIDLDGPEGQELWHEYRERFPKRPTVLLSLHDPAEKGASFLEKPARIDDLLETLKRIAMGGTKEDAPSYGLTHEDAAPPQDALAPRQSGKTSPILSTRTATRAMEKATRSAYDSTIPRSPQLDPNDSKNRTKCFFREEDYLLGEILKEARDALNDRVAREITCRNGRIVILPARGLVSTDLSDTRLKQLSFDRTTAPDGARDASAVHFNLEVRRLPTPEKEGALPQAEGNELRSTPLDAFLWKLAVWTSRGRAAAGTDLDKPVVLAHWPNLTRLLITPDALRIAALWARQPRSMLDTARALEIPLAHVLTFHAALSAIGITTPARRQIDYVLAPEPIATDHRGGLLSRILARLRGPSPGDAVAHQGILEPSS